MKNGSSILKRYIGGSIALLGLCSVSNASVINTLLTGSTGTVTVTTQSIFFNHDPSAIGTCALGGATGCNSDVTTNTSLAFTGGPLGVGEGVYINNGDLTTGAPTDPNNFLTFAAHPLLVFSLSSVGPGSSNTNCAAVIDPSSAPCSVFLGSPIVLAFGGTNTTNAFISVHGKASDTGVSGLATGSVYNGSFSEGITQLLPNGMQPTPGNIQAYFCPGGVCDASKSITTSQSGTFTAASSVPEPSSVFLSSMGILMLAVGTGLRKVYGSRA